MRRIRTFSIVLFVLAIIVFGLVEYKMWLNSDATGPTIDMEQKSVTVSVDDGDAAVLSGITAIDEKDGDVTDSLIVENFTNFIEQGRRNVTIAAFDKDNHVTKVVREVVYSDYRAPLFTLSAPIKFPKNTESILSYIGAEDVLDGNLTSNIKISTDYNVQVDTEGLYEVIFSVANSAGDVAELPVTVEIYNVSDESQKPQIGLSEYIVYTKVGSAVDPLSYIEHVQVGAAEYVKDESGVLRNSVNEDDVITAEDMVITNPVDINTPGVYEIVYELEVENRKPGNVRLVVVVE